MLALVATLLALTDPCIGEHPSGEFITCFDPGRGLELSAGGSAVSLAAGADFGLAIRVRGERDSKSKAGTTWLSSHKAAAVTARISPAERQLSAFAYEGIFRRHVDEGSLLLPFSTPVRLPFPFDVGLYTKVARWERRVEDGPGWTFEPARIAMLFDPLRSETGRFHLGFGPALAYQLRHDGMALSHELTPLTALQVAINAESEDGLWVLRAGGWAGWTFAPGAMTGGATFRARGEVALERVVLAVNDQPISVQVRATGALRDAGALAQNEWGVGGALKVQLFAQR